MLGNGPAWLGGGPHEKEFPRGNHLAVRPILSTPTGCPCWSRTGAPGCPRGSPTRTRCSWSRSPADARGSWVCRSRTGASASSRTTSAAATAAPTRHRCRTRSCGSAGNGCGEILHSHDITFQRTRTWKEARDPAKDAKLDRIEEVISRFPDRVFAFDQFGPLSIRPCHGTCWAREKHPDRLPATYHRYHGVRYFHGCYDLARDQLWGVLHEHKGGAHTLAALNSIRTARPDGAPIYIVLGGVSGIAGADRRVASSLYRLRTGASPTRPGALAQTGRKFIVGIRRAPPRGAQRTAPGAGCGEHARGSRRPRRCRCGEEFRGLGRRIAAALGRRTQHSLAIPADLRGDVAEQWRSGRGNVADHRETLTGRGGTHGTKPCGAGMPAGLDVAHGERDRAHGRQLPPLSPPQRVNKGRNLRHMPSQRAGCPGTAQ